MKQTPRKRSTPATCTSSSRKQARVSLSSNTAHSPEPSGRTVIAEALDVLNTGLDGLRALVLRARAALGVGPPVTSIYKQFVNLRAAADAVLWRSLSEHRWSRDETFEEAVAALLQEGYASDPEISDPPPLTSGQLVKLCSARSCLCAAEAELALKCLLQSLPPGMILPRKLTVRAA